MDEKISTGDLAKLLGVADRTIAKLVAKKVLRREDRGTFNAPEFVQAYVAHREATVAAEQGQGAYGKARAQLYLERARVARIRREELEGSLAPLSQTRAAWIDILTMLRARLLSIPTKLAPLLVALKTASDAETIVRAAIHEALEELSRPAVVAPKHRKKVSDEAA